MQLSKSSAILAILLSGTLASAANFTENFDDFNALGAQGWAFVNNSSQQGNYGWTQPVSPKFNAQSGAADSYLNAQFDNGDDSITGAAISDWALTPVLDIENGTVLTFYTRTEPGGSVFGDNLEVRLSTAGSSADVGSDPASTGDFNSLALSINPDSSPDVYPEDWTQYTYTVSGLSGNTYARFGFRYLIADNTSTGDIIGLDSLEVANLAPEPGSVLIVAIGLGFLGLRWRRRLSSALVAMFLLIPLTFANAQEKKTDTKSAEKDGQAGKQGSVEFVTPTASGQMVFVDPKTHKIRPPEHGEVNALSASSRRQAFAARAPQVRKLSNGTRMVYLGSSRLVSEVATVDKNGKVRTGSASAGQTKAGRQVAKEQLDEK
jgi:hypothetical protein